MHNSYLILVLIFLSVCALKWSFLITPSSMTARNSKSLMFSSNPTNTQDDPIPTKVESVVPVISETPEEKYKREKLAEIAERKAAEVFVVRNTGRYECQACGYIYAESDGNPRKGIAPNTPFESLEKFRCPQCGVDKKYFVPETETLSGFKENLKYGFGGNSLTSGQKSNLIFGGLFLGFLIFMSGYLLE